MKRMFCSMIAAFALITAVHAKGTAPEIAAHAAILMHMDSGSVLYEKNADERMLIASTTKIMTALVVLDSCAPSELVTIKPEHCAVEGSSAYLRPGEEYTVESLLCGLLLASGNDAAKALAEHAAGSEEAFVACMNARAQQLGLENTHFVNPHGLDAEDHYSSAFDLARLTCEAMKNELFAEIVSAPEKACGERVYINHNRLLRRYDGCRGVKTGYTKAAGRCLVSCAERDGLRLVCVTLSDPRDWDDHAALFDSGFSEWRFARLTVEERFADIPVIAGNNAAVRVKIEGDAAFLCPKDADYEVVVYLPRFVYADVAEGDAAGEISAIRDGEKLFSAQLVFVESAARSKEARLSVLERIRRGFELSVRYGGISPFGTFFAPREAIKGNLS